MKPRGTPKQRRATVQRRMQRVRREGFRVVGFADLDHENGVGYLGAPLYRSLLVLGVDGIAGAVVAAWNEGPAIPRPIPPTEHAPPEPAR